MKEAEKIAEGKTLPMAVKFLRKQEYLSSYVVPEVLTHSCYPRPSSEVNWAHKSIF